MRKEQAATGDFRLQRVGRNYHRALIKLILQLTSPYSLTSPKRKLTAANRSIAH